MSADSGRRSPNRARAITGASADMTQRLARRFWALMLFASPAAAQQISFPAGVVLPIRVLHAVTGGRDTVGSPVIAQTLAALVRDSCVIVPPFAVIRGHVV